LNLKIVGHPEGKHIKSLIEVPWLVYESGDRKMIEDGEVNSQSRDIDDTKIHNRLDDLGYIS
jgi:hypothetical protein